MDAPLVCASEKKSMTVSPGVTLSCCIGTRGCLSPRRLGDSDKSDVLPAAPSRRVSRFVYHLSGYGSDVIFLPVQMLREPDGRDSRSRGPSDAARAHTHAPRTTFVLCYLTRPSRIPLGCPRTGTVFESFGSATSKRKQIKFERRNVSMHELLHHLRGVTSALAIFNFASVRS